MTTTRRPAQIVVDMMETILNEAPAGTITTVVGQHEPRTGYAVAMDEGAVQITQNRTGALDAMINFVDANLPWAAATQNAFFGVWTDNHTGIVYIDRVVVFHELHTAKEIGLSENQLAIWDFDNGIEIRL